MDNLILSFQTPPCNNEIKHWPLVTLVVWVGERATLLLDVSICHVLGREISDTQPPLSTGVWNVTPLAISLIIALIRLNGSAAAITEQGR